MPVLENVLEPPSTEHIHRSFESLYETQFLTAPSDEGDITPLGHFVSSLGCDLLIGRLVGLSAMYGLLPEGVALATVLSSPRAPFRVATPLVHTNPDEYNGIVVDSMLARSRFDKGMHCEPLMMVSTSLWLCACTLASVLG